MLEPVTHRLLTEKQINQQHRIARASIEFHTILPPSSSRNRPPVPQSIGGSWELCNDLDTSLYLFTIFLFLLWQPPSLPPDNCDALSNNNKETVSVQMYARDYSTPGAKITRQDSTPNKANYFWQDIIIRNPWVPCQESLVYYLEKMSGQSQFYWDKLMMVYMSRLFVKVHDL